MPTSNNPPRPSNPHSEGELHQSELQQKAAPQSLEDAAPNETSTEATTITSSLREKASIESIPAANHTQKPEKNNIPVEEKSNPQNSSEKKTDFYNFFSDDPIVYWILFSLASVSLIFTVNYLYAIFSISNNHLEESRKLFSSFSEHSDNDWAKITNLRTAAQSATFHLMISLSIFTLCFFNPIWAIFKNNIKKTLITISTLLITISIITQFTLYYFKYIGDIVTLSFLAVITTTSAFFIAIVVIFKIIEKISIFLRKAINDRKGEAYTKSEQALHYIIFIFPATITIFVAAFFVLLADTFSTALYDQYAQKTTPIFLEEFFTDPDTKIILPIFLLFSLMLNTSTATSIIIIIEEIFKNKRRKKAKRIILPTEEKSTRSTITSHIKLILPLLPLAASIVFILALIHNTQVTDNNLSTAIQITAIQFTDSKYIWLTMAFSLLLMGYISSIPYFLLPQCVNSVERIFPRSRNGNAKNEVEYIYFMITFISLALTSFCALINYQILKILSHKEVIIFFLATIFISFALCSISLRNIIDKKYTPKSTAEIRSRTHKEKITLLILTTLSAFLISSISSALIPNITKGFSDMITNPGDTLGSIETDYSCVFSNNVEEKNSIAFGVIVESKPDSVHIFTPEYNQEKNSYGEEVGNGKVKPNKLAESQVKIPGGYRIEKFDNNKHGYDLTVGKCIYRNSPPFYMYTYSWNTSDRN